MSRVLLLRKTVLMTDALQTYELPNSLSPSSINTFQQCPLKFKVIKLDKAPFKQTEHTVLGSFVHEVLEHLFMVDRKDRTEATAKMLCRQLWESTWNEKFLELDKRPNSNEFRWKAWWCVENYFAMEDPTSFDASGLEEKLEGTIDDVPIFGIIDRWSLENNKIVISDYKTGKKPAPKYSWETKMQISIYAIMLKEQLGLEVDRTELLYVKPGKIVTYRLSDDLESEVRVTVRNTWDEVKSSCASGVFETRPGPLCDWCDHKPLCPAFRK